MISPSDIQFSRWDDAAWGLVRIKGALVIRSDAAISHAEFERVKIGWEELKKEVKRKLKQDIWHRVYGGLIPSVHKVVGYAARGIQPPENVEVMDELLKQLNPNFYAETNSPLCTFTRGE